MSRFLSAALMVTAAFVALPARAQVPDEMKIDKDRFLYGQIRDDTAFQPSDANPGEYEAYAAVLLHARQFDADALLKAARRDVAFKDLFRNTDEFRLELVAFDGRLRMLRRSEPTKALKEAGVKDLYEAWIFPAKQENPLAVCFTELPLGLVPQQDLERDVIDRRVSVAGYPFKIFQYESQEPDPTHPGRKKYRRAPLLMAKSIQVKNEPSVADQSEQWHTTFGPTMVGCVGGLGVLVVGLTWWFRRGDRLVRETIDARRDANPFAV